VNPMRAEEFQKLWDEGRRREALDGARATARAGGEEEMLLKLAEALAIAGHQLGAWGMAEETYQIVTELRQKVWGPEHFHGAYAHKALADWYRDVGRFDEAERTMRLSLDIAERRWKEDPRPVRNTLLDLAGLSVERKDLAAAESFYQRALEVEESSARPDRDELRFILNELRALYSRQGRIEDAAKALARRLTLSKTLGKRPDLDDAHDLTVLAELRRRMGRQKEADALLERANRIRARARGKG
jgi:tetratricopeptide (TPR) repeat protein